MVPLSVALYSSVIHLSKICLEDNTEWSNSALTKSFSSNVRSELTCYAQWTEIFSKYSLHWVSCVILLSSFSSFNQQIMSHHSSQFTSCQILVELLLLCLHMFVVEISDYAISFNALGQFAKNLVRKETVLEWFYCFNWTYDLW